MLAGIDGSASGLAAFVGTVSLAQTGGRNRNIASVREPVSTATAISCDPRYVSAADPLLVARRHVDLLRVRSAICRHGR
ncbi:MAG: putative leader peptide [Streptosporangiaceae bacterium]